MKNYAVNDKKQLEYILIRFPVKIINILLNNDYKQ